ncbi:tetratricopeptide repeat protein [candidate division KSB1 bacterium]|nr:tetratricopeptide repeat protein [candidate division KSB1 bacterium]
MKNRIDISRTIFTVFQSPWLARITIVIAGIICYAQTLNFSFHFDDFYDIVNNPDIRNLSDISAWWHTSHGRPIAMLTFALNYHVHGLSVQGYHSVNILIHLMNAFLVYELTKITLTTPKIDNDLIRLSDSIAFVAGLLFVIHPVQTQAVTYIVQRMASLATLFYFASLLCYINARISTNRRTRLLYFGISALSALLGMYTKQIVFTLPIIIMLYEFTFFSSFKSISMKHKIGAGILLATALVIIPLTNGLDLSLLNREIPPQQGHPETITTFTYFLTQTRALMTYLRLFFIPIHQQLDYYYRLSTQAGDPAVLLSSAGLIALLLLAVFSFKKNKLFAFGLIWFFVTISVESGVIALPNVIFEHRMYLPLMGLIWAVLALLYSFASLRRPRISSGVLVFVSMAFIGMTVQRNQAWQNETTLWSDNVLKAPENPRAWASRSTVYLETNELNPALADANKALDLCPTYTIARLNRGIIYYRLQQFERALADFNNVLESHPDHFQALNNRGLVYIELKQYSRALDDFNKAIALNPVDVKARFNRGKAYFLEQQLKPAIADFSFVINQQPDQTDALLYRGLSYSRSNDVPAAIADLTELTHIHKANANVYLLLGQLYIQQTEYQHAITAFTSALNLQPDLVEALNNRGNSYMLIGQFEKALDDYSRAITLSPDYTNALYNRSRCYYSLNKYKLALNDATKIRQLGADIPNGYYKDLVTRTSRQQAARRNK